jgi:hypothetical protein
MIDTGALNFLLSKDKTKGKAAKDGVFENSYELGKASKLKKMNEDEDYARDEDSFKRTIDIKKLNLNIKPIVYEPPNN